MTAPTHASVSGPAPGAAARPPGHPARPAPAANANSDDQALELPSFEAFYAGERVRLVRALAFTLGDADLAAEAIDEACTRAYERWASVAGGSPGAWVYRVGLNWSLSVLRTRRRRRGRSPLYDAPAAIAEPGEPAVAAALAGLDPKHRSVVVCRHLLGWSVRETAAALHLREGTVKSRLSRATALLQSELAHLRPSEESR